MVRKLQKRLTIALYVFMQRDMSSSITFAWLLASSVRCVTCDQQIWRGPCAAPHGVIMCIFYLVQQRESHCSCPKLCEVNDVNASSDH
jgi:hypothetical protein